VALSISRISATLLFNFMIPNGNRIPYGTHNQSWYGFGSKNISVRKIIIAIHAIMNALIMKARSQQFPANP